MCPQNFFYLHISCKYLSTFLYNLDISSCEQQEPIGTGDAVKCGINEVKEADKVLVLYGDVPLIKEKTLKELINSCNDGISILTTVLDQPFGYGRVKKIMIVML